MTDVQVQAMRYQFVNGERQLVNSGRVAQTDDLGQYRIFGLMPGEYVIRASLRQNLDRPGTPAEPDPMGYPGTYYPGVLDVGQATVGDGDARPGAELGRVSPCARLVFRASREP